MKMRIHPLLTGLLSLGATGLLPAQAEEEVPSAEEVKFFEAKIRPVFVEYCYKCHSTDEKIKGGLQLDTREGLRHGGDSGPALVPGKPEESLLWTAITWQDEDYEMPPKQKLSESIRADFRKWIEMGAPDPREREKIVLRTEIDIAEGRQFWSFQKPEKTSLPAVEAVDWPQSEVDRFLLAALEEEDLTPARDAEADALLRRLYIDLIGLPPTPEEFAAYGVAWRKDPVAAYRAKVDELLARPQFGERWGRHWLDVARYAESSGKEINMTYPHAWRYRDYVIDSFNEDKPYDQFVREQVAGDLLEIESDEDWQENLIATGFLALGPKGLNERNPRQFALDLADEQIDVTTQAILGLTVSCARCHDHKSDPIPTVDYYALSGIFQSTRTYFGTVNLAVSRRGTKLLDLPVADEAPLRSMSAREMAFVKERLSEAEEELVEMERTARENRRTGGNNNAQQQILRLRRTVTGFRARLNGVDSEGVGKSLGMGVQDYPRPVEPVVLVRGELDKPAQEVPRGFLQVLAHEGTPETLPSDGSGRLQLAQWLTSAENPLPARVMVNRIWQKLFGQGLVTSTSNFGATGQAPSHPELLDYLAVRFVEEGWSVKAMIRGLVNTRAYQLSSEFNREAYLKDPGNVLLWRFTPRRLDAEVLRDAMLCASGEMDLERPRGSTVARAGDTVVGQRLSPELLNRQVTYRSVYLPFVRDGLPESLALFDAADPNLVTGERESTNVPGQALYLMNNGFVLRRGDVMAQRLGKETQEAEERIRLAFKLAYGRKASTLEMEQAKEFLWSFTAAAVKKGEERSRAGYKALRVFCQALLVSAEFRYLN
ncbi:MAG: PSD1 and planctomycete cytochrome C domain-containing protein [Roseibacillus sp.]